MQGTRRGKRDMPGEAWRSMRGEKISHGLFLSTAELRLYITQICLSDALAAAGTDINGP